MNVESGGGDERERRESVLEAAKSCETRSVASFLLQQEYVSVVFQNN